MPRIPLGQVAGNAYHVLNRENSDAVVFHKEGIYTAFLDTGDHVIVINAAEVHLSGRKETDKLYRSHSGFVGGLKTTAAGDMRKKHPTRVIEEAVKGMLPKTKLGRAMFQKLKVYAGDKHPHQAQQPQPVTLASSKK